MHCCRFNKVKYTIQAVHSPPHATSSAATADSLRQIEAKLLQKKTQLQTFGAEFRQACLPYSAAFAHAAFANEAMALMYACTAVSFTVQARQQAFLKSYAQVYIFLVAILSEFKTMFTW